jgi:transcriptional regulator with XRE-family HTH domain
MTDDHLQKSLFSPAYTRFLALFRQARIAAGLTQVEAAKRLGRPQSFVSKCESGERRVDVIEFIQFCRVYGVNPSALVEQIARETRKKPAKARPGNPP